ncbi:MAG: pyridoxamine 5'-phosphate oxidase family protein [Pseudomonadota bacterium]
MSKSPQKIDPIRPTDDEARALARSLISNARFGAIAVTDPDTESPSVTRIAVSTTPSSAPLTLISDLSSHTTALRANPRCSLLLGEPGPKGDPLTHPRITLDCNAAFLLKGEDGYDPMRDHYLTTHPKSKLYIDFLDFNFVLFDVLDARLNGGFGKAFRLTPTDLGLTR